LGGNDHDYSAALLLDEEGMAGVASTTRSSDYPFTEGAFDVSYNASDDVCIAMLSQNGNELIFSTYIGGSGYDISKALASDGVNGLVITGTTGSDDFPTTDGAYDRSFNASQAYECFIAKLNSEGNQLIFGTFLGGEDSDAPDAIIANGIENVIVAGSTDSYDFPTTEGGFDRSYNGFSDAFVAKMNLVNLTIGEESTRQTIPSDYFLADAFPNPFNSTTTIRFGLPVAGEVSLSVWDLSGKKVVDLLTGWKPVLPAGYYEAVWDAGVVPAGVYLVRMHAGTEVVTRKVVLVR
jgi:hypothetical protein